MKTLEDQTAPRVNFFYFCCICVSLFVFVARPGEVFPVLAGTRLGLISFAFTCVAFFAAGGPQAIWQEEFSGLKLMLLFLLLGFLVIPFSSWPRGAFEGWRTILLINTMLFLFWIPAVQQLDRLRIFVIVLVLAVACLVVAMLFVESAMLNKGAKLGRLSVGATYDPNDIAMIIVVVFPYTVFLFSQARLKGKILWGGVLVCLVQGVLATVSRGGILALGVACLLLFFSTGKGVKTWHKVFVVALVTVFFMSQEADTVKERWQSIFSGEDYNVEKVEEGGSGRLSLWISGLQLICENPLTGIGVKNTSNAMGVEYGRWRALHNSYLQAALELGVGGGVLYLLLLRAIWRNCGQALAQVHQKLGQAPLVLLAKCTRVSLITYMVAAFFLSQAYSLMVPILLLVSEGVHRIAREMRKDA